MKELILIKLGGSVITDKSKPFTANTKNIDRLAAEIKRKYIKKGSDLILGHGSGSFAHIPAARYQIAKGIINKNSIWGFCQTADAAIQINRIIIERLLKSRVKAASFAPMSFIYEKTVLTEHIKNALKIGIIPVIYGDVIMDAKKGFHINSGEMTLDLLAKKLSKSYKKVKVIYYTDTFGVYDDRKKTIPLISAKNFKDIKKYLMGSKNVDVTGGMVHKVQESLELAKKIDAEVYIMNGMSRGKYTLITR